jgi:REP element-mobilizing transposase RayT
MPQSFASITLHIVFSTKNRVPHLTSDVRPDIHHYVGGTIRGNHCAPLAVGGVADHIHLLVGWGREISVVEFVKVVKASSTRWAHDTIPALAGFSWQAGYGAFSVSHDRVDAVRRYIENQEEHHRTVSFQYEYREFLRKHNIEWDERYVWD